MSDLVLAEDEAAVRVLTLNRPEALNAFNQGLCDALADALLAAERDDGVRVVILTGAGRAFSAGTDLIELAHRGDFRRGPHSVHGFEGMMDVVAAFPKPFVCAVNGLAVGIGSTILGQADLAFMASTARLRCPFTALGLAPEAASSVTFPLLMGRQAAAWVLLSSEWLDAREAARAGLVWRVVEPEALLPEARKHARRLAAWPLRSLVESKRLISEAFADAIAAARRRESAAFDRLLGAPDNRNALLDFTRRSRLT